MFKNITKVLAILILGMIGGILYQAFLLPYLASKPYFAKFQFIKELKERQVIIYPKEEIIIQENIALKNAIEKVQKVVVGVKSVSKTSKGTYTLEGSGLIVTSDGLLVTLAELLPQGANFSFFVEGKIASFQILKRDQKKNLALVKIEEKNLPTTGFADFGRLRLGERVFLVGVIFNETGTNKTVNEGIITVFGQDILETNIVDKNNIEGSPIFDIEGNIVGLSTVNKEGDVSIISVKQIKEFIGF